MLVAANPFEIETGNKCCGTCDYDLTGLRDDGPVACPECGAQHDRNRVLLRGFGGSQNRGPIGTAFDLAVMAGIYFSCIVVTRLTRSLFYLFIYLAIATTVILIVRSMCRRAGLRTPASSARLHLVRNGFRQESINSIGQTTTPLWWLLIAMFVAVACCLLAIDGDSSSFQMVFYLVVFAGIAVFAAIKRARLLRPRSNSGDAEPLIPWTAVTHGYLAPSPVGQDGEYSIELRSEGFWGKHALAHLLWTGDDKQLHSILHLLQTMTPAAVWTVDVDLNR